MELELLFSNSKWNLLVELSKEPKSPLELSSIFKTSVANISQQLRLMEAMGVIGKLKTQNYLKGKPRTLYHVKDEIYYILRLGKTFASKQVLKNDPFTIYILNVFSILSKKDHFFLSKFFCDNIDLLSDSSIGVFKNSDKTIELFIITEKLDDARKRISNVEIISFLGGSKKIVCWTHNNAETTLGLKNNDSHFINLINDSIILFDVKEILQNFKVTLKNE